VSAATTYWIAEWRHALSSVENGDFPPEKANPLFDTKWRPTVFN